MEQMDNYNKIAVMIPVYNTSEKYLRECLESVAKQTMKGCHIIMIDDGSTDKHVWPILKEYVNKYENFSLAKKENGGTGSALNLATEMNVSTSNSKYSTFFASDNIMYPEMLETLSGYLEKHPEVDFVYAETTILYMDEKGEKVIKTKSIKSEVGDMRFVESKFFDKFNMGICWLWRTELQKKAGPWEERLCEDFIMISRMIMAGGKFYFYDAPFAYHRRHNKNLSTKIQKEQPTYTRDLIAEMKREYSKDRLLDQEIKNTALANIFSEIFKHKLWHGKESLSGRGSDVDQTKELLNRLPNLFQKYNVGTIVDSPCGDCAWISKLNLPHYTGLDIVKGLIEDNKQKYPLYKFAVADISDPDTIIPKVDLILCRDALVHLSYEKIINALKNFIKSGSKYLLLTSFTKQDRENKDIVEDKFQWRVLNFQNKPFNFPAPLYTLNEKCPERGYDDKCLLLYDLKEIEKCLVKDQPKIQKPVAIEKQEPVVIPDLVIDVNWKLSKIPKIAYFYWGQQPLPFLRYITLYSFCKFNPTWKVILYQPSTSVCTNTWTSGEHPVPFVGKDYTADMKKLPIEFKTIPSDFYPKYPEVFKSDLLRWKLLSETGGFWIDMDILFFRPMNKLTLNQPSNAKLDTIVNYFEYNKVPIHSIGFLGSSAGNKFYEHIWDKARKHKINFDDYQTLGNFLIHTEFKTIEDIKRKFGSTIDTVTKDTVYAYFTLKRVSELFQSPAVNYLKQDSIGIHWYAGAEVAGRWVNKIDKDNYSSFQNIICQLIDRVSKI